MDKELGWGSRKSYSIGTRRSPSTLKQSKFPALTIVSAFLQEFFGSATQCISNCVY
jgi:hypothetical protein